MQTMQFPNGAMVAGGGGEIHHPRPWFPDERDGFISWLRAEFAASNAIIDSLCHHLRSVGDPGEYDFVIGCVQQRRVAWNHVLHLQQFYPITDIMGALQQVTWGRQSRVVDQARFGGKEFKRSSGVHSFGSGNGQWAEATKGIDNSSINSPHLGVNASVPVSKEKKGMMREREEVKLGHDIKKSDLLGAQKVADASLKSQVDSSLKTSKNRDGTDYPCTDSPSEEVKDGKTSNANGSRNLIVGKNDDAIQNQEESLIISPKTFYAMEMYEGKMVNVAEGLNLYEEFLGEEEVSKLISLVNDLRATGINGQLPGPTFLVSKKPFRGHGREIIQLGVAVSDVASDIRCVFGRVESTPNNSAKDWTVEPIPDLLQSLINRLINLQLTPMKPDSCVIDVFNEGDYSHPQHFPLWYGRPICLLSLNECETVFGTEITGDRSGDRSGIYKGALSLTLTPGSLLVMQGNSTDISKRAMPSTRKKRILITFLKSQPKRAFQGDGQRLHLQGAHASNWAPPPIRQPNHIRPKHYTPVPFTGVLPAPPIRAQLPPSNGTPPLFVPPSAPTSMAFPASMPLPLPRLPVPGTGVFLPGSGSPSPTAVLMTAAAEMSSTIKTTQRVENEDVDVKVNGSILNSPKQCNGREDQQQRGEIAETT